MNNYLFLLLATCLTSGIALGQTSTKLNGTAMGSTPSVDYSTSEASTTVNTFADAFDGNLETYYASYERSFTWVGMDLGTPHIITRVGWSPRNDGVGPKRVELAIFEGANNEDFSDAMPIYLIDSEGTIGKMSYGDVDVTRSFRYVRYVSPNNARCNVAEVEFYGYEGEGSDSKLYQPTNLPVVVINVENRAFPQDKVNDLNANVSIISKNGTEQLTATATVRLRGNASMDFPKKPFRIKFESKQRVLDAPAKAKKWTLINNYGDKTLMRNMVAFEISRQLGMEYTPFSTPVDVIVNGEYQGCYQLCDQIEVNKNRVNVEEMTPEMNNEPDITGGYLIEVDAYAYDEVSYFNSNHNTPVTIKYPDEEDITYNQIQYIKKQFNELENRVYNSKSDLGKILNIESFLRHFIVGELSGNTDTYWSTYMYKHRSDDHFYVGPVWDFDIAFDNDYRTYPLMNKTDYTYRSGGSVAGDMRTFVDKLVIYNSAVKQQLSDVWSEARNSKNITAEGLETYIRNMATTLDQSQKLNFKRWDIMNTQVHMNPRNWGSYKAEVDHLVDYVTNRVTWMDKKIGLKIKDAITTITNDNNEPITVYNLMGTLVARGTTAGLTPGLYIIRQGKDVRKVIVGMP